MKKGNCFYYLLFFAALVLYAGRCMAADINLPKPALAGEVSVEAAIAGRRSIRNYEEGGLGVAAVSQLLWSAQGITDSSGKRAAPSAGAQYPLTVFVAAGDVQGLADGVYEYVPKSHSLKLVAKGDFREAISVAAMGQRWVRQAPAVFVIAVNYGRMKRYGDKGRMFADMEVGHAAENLSLQAVALGLGSVMVGAARDDAVARVLRIADASRPVYLIPVGKPKPPRAEARGVGRAA